MQVKRWLTSKRARRSWKKKYTFIDPSQVDPSRFTPLPKQLTPEEEAEILKCFREQIDPVELERECRELFRQAEHGELLSLESFLEELDQG